MILLLEARSNRLADLTPLVEDAEAVLSKARADEVVRVTAPYKVAFLPYPPTAQLEG